MVSQEAAQVLESAGDGPLGESEETCLITTESTMLKLLYQIV